jgi:nucleotide-binding universal stress UspA family protein
MPATEGLSDQCKINFFARRYNVMRYPMETHKILIPLDGSASSRQIVHSIQRLFRPADCELILLRVTEPPEGHLPNPPRPILSAWQMPLYDSRQDVVLSEHPTYASQVWENVRSEAESELLPDVRALKEAGYAVSVLIRAGEPARTIVDVAEHQAVDVVAMATHSRTGLRRLALGSVTEAVLPELTVPLLLVRPVEHGVKSRDAAESRTG